MIIRKFAGKAGQYEPLIDELIDWLNSGGFQTQKFMTEDNGIVIQLLKRGTWRNFVGMSSALNVVLYNTDGEITVKIGSGKWVDKAVIGAVSLVFFWPLSVTTGIGVWQQFKLPERIFTMVSQNLLK